MPASMDRPAIPCSSNMSDEELAGLRDRHCTHTFRYELQAALSHEEVCFPAGAVVQVLPDVWFAAPGKIVSNG